MDELNRKYQREKVRAARTSVLSNSLLVSIKLTVGFFMGSVAVLSEAIHSGLDLLASIIAFCGRKVRQTRR